jgi:hypothetical protein
MVNLNSLVNLPGDAKYDNAPLTAADLVWSIVNGAGYGSLPAGGAALTGTAPGTVTVKATLPADKNLGAERNAQTTITVEQAYPKYVTLRIIVTKLTNDATTDYVNTVVLIPRNRSLTPAVKATGHTNPEWVVDYGSSANDDSTYKKYFDNNYLPAQGLSYEKFDNLNLKNLKTEYTDILVPWPSSGVSGYDFFFVEGDSRVRGYVNPWGDYNPTGTKVSRNRVFHLDFQHIYDNYRLVMKGKTQVEKGTSGAIEVIPIHYSTNRNVGSIMKAKGAGSEPNPDYTDLTEK